MKRDNDNDLDAVFQKLRALDSRTAPEFSLPEIQNGRRWRVRSGAVVAGVAAVLCLTMIVFQHRDNTPSTPAQIIAFDQLSETISREFFVASAGDWEAPTDFLLTMDYSPPVNNQK
jgi:hypothetical protein